MPLIQTLRHRHTFNLGHTFCWKDNGRRKRLLEAYTEEWAVGSRDFYNQPCEEGNGLPGDNGIHARRRRVKLPSPLQHHFGFAVEEGIVPGEVTS